MTDAEAIIKLKTDSCVGCPIGWDSPINCRCEDCEVKIATATAIKALEKQIPKKPIAKHYEEAGEHPYVKYACPDCKTGISAVKENEKSYQNRFCHKCGQAIDWSEDE